MAWVKIDEHFYDHPKWCDAPGDSIALWLAAMAWCNRNDSDSGFIPDAKTRGLVNVRQVGRTLQDLCERRAFKRVPGGYLIHDYEEFQQPEKVREIAAKRAAAGRKGAAHRWEEKRRAEEYAAAPLPSEPHDNHMANGMANAMANECPDTDTGTEVLTSSSVLTVVPTHHSDDDDDWTHTASLIADGRVATRHGIRNPNGYRTRIIQQLRTEPDGELIRRMLNDGDPPEHVAKFVLGYGITTQTERATNTVPWCQPDCTTCEGDAWIDTGNGLAPCPNRKPQEIA